jgi:hypothetical protein
MKEDWMDENVARMEMRQTCYMKTSGVQNIQEQSHLTD